MFRVPGYYRDISEKLSSVLEDVGVSERIVHKRRRTRLLIEDMDTITNIIVGANFSVHYFGSQSEGTTTLGLDSDFDILYCNNDVNVIEDLADWKAGSDNFKMIQDENVSPGYCMLQVLDDNVPQPVTEILNKHYFKLRKDMLLLKNSIFDSGGLSGEIQNGPSFTYLREGYSVTDRVTAYPCKTMPRVVDNLIQTQMLNGKLSPDMQKYVERSPCFIVPAGNKGSSREYLEWRISTSHAERCVMFNLNITQIRCYVLMKMILKSLLKHPHEKRLSSFMLKNILILCIEKTPSDSWCALNLLKMLTLCLFELQHCIIYKHCPHFIEHRNNLMYRKFSQNVRVWLLKKIQDIIHSNGRALIDISIDDLGSRLQTHWNLINLILPSAALRDITGHLTSEVARRVSASHRAVLCALFSGNRSWTNIFQILVRFSYRAKAYRLLQPFLFANLGCVLASNSLQQEGILSPKALAELHAGMNSDVASGRLKLASAFYAVRDFDRVCDILRSTEETYDTDIVEDIEDICNCMYRPVGFYCSVKFEIYADNHNELCVGDITAHCVRFLPSEINSIPRELQYELFRSSHDDLLHRVAGEDDWMNWAVVDSLPYLYFLQYKAYGHLRKPGDQQRALRNLITVARIQNVNFGHRETAWNLAGQCMVQKDRPEDAFRCYVNSLNIRPRNNAANVHICILLYRVMCSQNVLK